MVHWKGPGTAEDPSDLGHCRDNGHGPPYVVGFGPVTYREKVRNVRPRKGGETPRIPRCPGRWN